MVRTSYVDPEDLPANKRVLLDTLSDDVPEEGEREHSLCGGTLNVYRAIGRNLPLLEGFRSYASVAWGESGLSPHDREVVILSIAYHAGSSYEWQQHVRVALDAGMEPEQLLAISREETDRLPPEHAAINAYVERFVDGRVTDETHKRLTEHYDEAVIIGIGMLSGCYLGLARVLQALDVDLESDFVGWDLENL
ncbi:carboxymuconolactone decarboxylase family protein [Halegenticoccus tardaugens]|uniref:carboxymuconolactone decarboxylase family protein n=1 Tax=Halegenticoccus tardaugens TaxID=2071624 RepID=UPI00100A7A88|nr:carboxymuconolactone decarboxylase family protein [Halegenticoccus tardaugens]